MIYPLLFVGVRLQLLALSGVCLEPEGFGYNSLGILFKHRHIKHIIVPRRRDHGTSRRVHTGSTHREFVPENTKV